MLITAVTRVLSVKISLTVLGITVHACRGIGSPSYSARALGLPHVGTTDSRRTFASLRLYAFALYGWAGGIPNS